MMQQLPAGALLTSPVCGLIAVLHRMAAALQVLDRVSRVLSAAKTELDESIQQLFPAAWLPRLFVQWLYLVVNCVSGPATMPRLG